MRWGYLMLFLALVLGPLWLSRGEAVQIPATNPTPPGPPSPPTLPQEPFIPPDKNDPLFQEFLKEVQKSGPMLTDPGRPNPSLPPPHIPRSPEQEQEMRWQSLEQLLRNAREIRGQAELLRTLGHAEQADHLNHLADELRRAAIQIVSPPIMNQHPNR